MIEFAPFRLDLTNQCLWRRQASGNEERLLLTPKAHAVLRVLVEHAGRLVTEAELLAAVWPAVHVQPEAVKTKLHEVRRALGDDAKAPTYIETLPRRGYRFIAPVREESVAAVQPSHPVHGRLVGREQVLSELRESLLMALQGQRTVVLLKGEAGVGKSAVLEEFQRRALGEIRHLRIGLGQCIEGYGGKEPYYAILDALGQLCRAESPSVVETLKVHAPTWLVQFPGVIKPEHRENLRQEILGATRERMIREIATALDILAAEKPLLLLLEDLQWVDDSTVDFLSALARRRTRAKLLVVATYRVEDVAFADHPLAAITQELLVRGLCRDLDVAPLTEDEVTRHLAHDSSLERVPDHFATLIWQRTAGNPLFIAAVLDDLAQRGLITRQDGSWRPAVPLEQLDCGVPDSLRQMIESQTRRLREDERRALEAASVAGQVFSTSAVAAAITVSPDDCDYLLEKVARERRVIVPVGIERLANGILSQRYAFVCALHRDVLYRSMGLVRRANLHRRVGEHLETLFAARPYEVAIELAHHFEQASDPLRAIKYRQLAAEGTPSRIALAETAAPLGGAHDLANRLSEANHRAPGRIRRGTTGDRQFPTLIAGAAH